MTTSYRPPYGIASPSVQIHGIIGDLLSDRWIAGLPQRNRPALVHIGDASRPSLASSVEHDWRSAGRVAAEHFLGRHHHHFYFASMGADEYAMRLLRQGYAEALAEADHEVTSFPLLCIDTAQHLSWEEMIRSMPPTPVAVLCKDDYAARHVLTAMRKAGRTVPEAASIIGVGCSSLDSFMAGVGISSIALDYTAMGREAARLMKDRMAHPQKRPEHRSIPPGDLELRATSGPGQLDVLVSRVLDFMETHLATPLSITSIARQFNASRRLLELRFRDALNSSPYAELVSMRMRLARQLLSNTLLPIATVAERCGYPETPHFYTRFKQHHGGLPPAVWRQRSMLSHN